MFIKFIFFLLVFTIVFITVTYLLNLCLSFVVVVSSFVYSTNQPISSSFIQNEIFESDILNYDLNQNNWLIDMFNIGLGQLKQIVELNDVYSEIAIRNSDTSIQHDLIKTVLPHEGIISQEGSNSDSKQSSCINSNCDKQFVSSNESFFYSQMNNANSIEKYPTVSIIYVTYDRQNSNDILNWLHLFTKYRNYNIRFALFDCNVNKQYCEKQNWNTPRLIYFVPNETSQKSKFVQILGKKCLCFI